MKTIIYVIFLIPSLALTETGIERGGLNYRTEIPVMDYSEIETYQEHFQQDDAAAFATTGAFNFRSTKDIDRNSFQVLNFPSSELIERIKNYQPNSVWVEDQQIIFSPFEDHIMEIELTDGSLVHLDEIREQLYGFNRYPDFISVPLQKIRSLEMSNNGATYFDQQRKIFPVMDYSEIETYQEYFQQDDAAFVEVEREEGSDGTSSGY